MSDNKQFGNSEQLESCDHEKDHVADPGNMVGDLISRARAIETVRKAKSIGQAHRMLMQLPSAQPNLSEAYCKAVFTWLMNYQIRTAELKGRYTPYEVLSWVINDWRKENG